MTQGTGTRTRQQLHLITAGLAAAAAVAAAPGLPSVSPVSVGADVRAVVTFSGSAPVKVPGVHVLATFPHVGAEVVSGTADRVEALVAHPRVDGVAADDSVRLDSYQHRAGKEPGVFGWQGVDDSGRPDSGAGVTVAVLDTGATDTAALNRASGRLVDGVDTSRLRGGGDARTSGTFTDGYGHGTFMANIIAGGRTARTLSNKGVGVAPASRVVVVKVADDRGRTSLSQVLAGLDWVAAQAPKIQVVNIALSHDRPSRAYGADPLTAAVKHVTASGVLVVAAAGNDPGQVGDPGLAPESITVGAADLTDRGRVTVAPFSGSANVAGVTKPDFVASGVDVLSLLPPQSVVARTHPSARQSNGFYRGSGTSESTAITTGAVAVLLSRHPEARLIDVKPALRVAADRIGSRWGSRAQGKGLLNLSGALRDLRQFNRHGHDDPTGENALDAAAWARNAWLKGSWQSWLAHAWSANSWSGSNWSANSWSANSWSGSNWSANSWSANSWSANSWSANSWSANSWSGSNWSANSWSANSWSANSWSANSWSTAYWGDRR